MGRIITTASSSYSSTTTTGGNSAISFASPWSKILLNSSIWFQVGDRVCGMIYQGRKQCTEWNNPNTEGIRETYILFSRAQCQRTHEICQQDSLHFFQAAAKEGVLLRKRGVNVIQNWILWLVEVLQSLRQRFFLALRSTWVKCAFTLFAI